MASVPTWARSAEELYTSFWRWTAGDVRLEPVRRIFSRLSFFTGVTGRPVLYVLWESVGVPLERWFIVETPTAFRGSFSDGRMTWDCLWHF